MIRMTFEQVGAENARQRWSDRWIALQRERRTMIETETHRLLGFVREEAPRKTGVFAAGIRSNVTESFTRDLSATIQSFGEHSYLEPFITKGTRAHEIPTGGAAAQMAKGYPLRFYWEKGPRGPGIYYYWRVWHPGTKPNDFVGRALRRWRPWATRRMKQVGVSIMNVSRGW